MIDPSVIEAGHKASQPMGRRSWGIDDDDLERIYRAMQAADPEWVALREALERLTHYAECQVVAFSSGRPYLDMTALPRLCEEARAALARSARASSK